MYKERFLKEELDRMIADLYDTATMTGDWDAWVRATADRFGGHSSLFALADRKTGKAEILSAPGFGQRTLQLYGEYYNRLDIWANKAAQTPMKAMISADLCTDEEFADSEICIDLLKPHQPNVFYVVGSVFSVGNCAGVIGIQRPRDAGQFSREHARGLDLLLPHIRRAYLIRARLHQSEAERATSLGALDQIDHGIMLADRDGVVLYANRAAERLLAQKDGVSIGRQKELVAARPAETAELKRLIADCALPAGGGAMRIGRPSALRPFEVIVAPLGIQTRAAFSAQASAMVFIRDPEVVPRAMPSLLRQLYGLTTAESELAADLAAQSTLAQIAEARGVSHETVRAQLKEVFRKTGTFRQSELVGLLVSGLASVAAARPKSG